jgi:hypothetical protein
MAGTPEKNKGILGHGFVFKLYYFRKAILVKAGNTFMKGRHGIFGFIDELTTVKIVNYFSIFSMSNEQ